MSKQFKADLSLLMVTVVWGLSFVLTKNALQDISTYNFLAIRFILSFTFSSIIFYKNMLKVNKNTIIYGLIIGVILFGAYAFQTVGLNYTTASKSGFITGFSVVIVPIVTAMILKKLPSFSTLLGVSLAVLGLGLMTLNSELIPNIGDFYTLICAFGFAFHIIMVEKYTIKVDSISLAIIQIGVVGILSLIFSIFTEEFIIPTSSVTWGSIFITGIFATSGAYIVQNYMQKFTSATHTALIYTGEPVFSAIFAYILLNEVMSTKSVIGSLLILFGMILGELKFSKGFSIKELLYRSKT